MFLSSQRINTITERSARQQEPTVSAFAALQAAARTVLVREPAAPEHWHVPGYYSDGPGHTRAKQGLADDANGAYSLALLYRLTGEEAAAAGAARLLDAWAGRVRSFSTKDDSTLSFSYHFPAMLFAADLLRESPSWPQEHQELFSHFVRDKALPLNTMDRANNWGNWGLVLVLAAAGWLNDDALFERGVARWKEFIETQMEADGTLHHEVTRNNGVGEHGLWYSHFTLMPQSIAAEIALCRGIDLYDYRSPSGRSLRLAFDRLVPWVCDPATFPYFKGGAGQKQVATQYISYWEILNARWPRPDAAKLIAEKRPLSATHAAPHLTLTHGEPPPSSS